MGAIGDMIGGVLGAVGGLFGGGGNYDEQQDAIRQQQAAQQQSLKLQQNQQKQNLAMQQQQMKKANAQMSNAAAAVSDTPTATNPANLTGGLGVDPSELMLGTSSLLSGTKKKDDNSII